MEAVTSNKLIGSIIAKLQSKFPEIAVLADEPAQEAVKPVITVGLKSISSAHELANRYSRTYLIQVTYKPESDTPNQAAYDVSDRLFELFGSVELNGAVYPVKEVTCEITDGALVFAFGIQLLVWLQENQ